MKTVDPERQDWILIPVILVIGLLCVIVAGQLALRFSPHWTLNTDMKSRIDPNSAYLTRRPSGLVEPVDASILTQPGWVDFLTPGISIITGTPFPERMSTTSPVPTTLSSATPTVVITSSSTDTLVFIPWTPIATQTRKPRPTKTQPPATATIYTPTFTLTSTSSVSTSTPTTPATATATPTATQTPVTIPTDPTPPEIGGTPDGNAYLLPAGSALTLGINLVANGDGGYDLVYTNAPPPPE